MPTRTLKGDIITNLFGDESYCGDIDAFWALQNAAIASLKEELAGNGWKVTVLEKGCASHRGNTRKSHLKMVARPSSRFATMARWKPTRAVERIRPFVPPNRHKTARTAHRPQ